MSDDNEKRERVQITTSAVLNKKQQEQVIKELEELEEHQKEQRLALEESKSLQRPKVAPWSKSEPLSKIHSILGHVAQGDAYRNELELVYDRLKGDAEAPEYLPSESEEDSQAMEALPVAKDPWADGFAFGMSAGHISTETSDTVSFSDEDPFAIPTSPVTEPNQHPPQESEHSDSQILDGVNLDDFDQLHKTAKTSGTLTSADVNAFLAQQAIDQLNSDALEHLAGDDLEDWQSLEKSNEPVDPNLIPKRERRPGQERENFFLHEDSRSSEMDTFSFEDSMSTSAGVAENNKKEEDQPLALGEPEDTVID